LAITHFKYIYKIKKIENIVYLEIYLFILKYKIFAITNKSGIGSILFDNFDDLYKKYIEYCKINKLFIIEKEIIREFIDTKKFYEFNNLLIIKLTFVTDENYNLTEIY